MSQDQAKVLFVDDEPNVLSGLKRQLRTTFDVYTAESGFQGLEILQEKGPFPVVVSDMRMPKMNGAIFLSKVRKFWPNTMRILLTGQSDIDSAISAINEGQIFRFLTKPCPTESLVSTLNTAIEQNKLLTVEKELLEKTLFSSVKVLTDILSLVNPSAFSQSSRIRLYINHLTSKLDIPGKWQYELASMLSQIGCVTVPAEILSKIHAHQPLTEEEQKLYLSHPEIGHDLITRIPRLKRVAQMIKGQHDKFTASTSIPLNEMAPELLGAQMLKLSLEFDTLISSGKPFEQAIQTLQKNQAHHHPELIDLISDLKDIKAERTHRMITASELTLSMIIDEDIFAVNGTLVVTKGQEVTDAMKARLIMISKNNGLKEPFRVIVSR